MTDHVAKQILDQVVTTCTGLSTTGSNVYRSRVHTLIETGLPCLLIFAREDIIEEDATGLQTDGKKGNSYIFSLSIDAVEKDASETTAEANLFEIRKEVQTAMEADLTLSGKCKDLWLVEANFEDRTGSGDSPILSLMMVWNILYRVKQGAPSTVLT
ncbi:MAG TPA: hypothetical protein EYN05_05035 [Nitrospinaceae bacterium]|nr:hypothetical protein [Nitrospina sp.]HIN88005.1 hypothetical protein [Nitrospinaceae bacterium]